MPYYDYVCDACDDAFSELHKIEDRRIPCDEPCKKCGEKSLRISIGAPLMVSGAPTNIQSVVPDGFKDVLKEMHKNAGKNSKIDV